MIGARDTGSSENLPRRRWPPQGQCHGFLKRSSVGAEGSPTKSMTKKKVFEYQGIRGYPGHCVAHLDEALQGLNDAWAALSMVARPDRRERDHMEEVVKLIASVNALQKAVAADTAERLRGSRLTPRAVSGLARSLGLKLRRVRGDYDHYQAVDNNCNLVVEGGLAHISATLDKVIDEQIAQSDRALADLTK